MLVNPTSLGFQGEGVLHFSSPINDRKNRIKVLASGVLVGSVASFCYLKLNNAKLNVVKCSLGAGALLGVMSDLLMNIVKLPDKLKSKSFLKKTNLDRLI